MIHHEIFVFYHYLQDINVLIFEKLHFDNININGELKEKSNCITIKDQLLKVQQNTRGTVELYFLL